MMFKAPEPLTSMVADMVADFLNRYDGYQFRVSEEHTRPSKWSGGSQTLTITVTCPTGEPPLTEQAES